MPETVDAVVKEVRIAATPDTVFPYLVEADKLSRWLCDDAQTDPRPGGINHQTHPGPEGDTGGPYRMRGEFLELEPPHRVVFTWGYEGSTMGTGPGSTTVEVTLTEEDGGTHLRLVHRDLNGDARAGHDRGWGSLLERLATVV